MYPDLRVVSELLDRNFYHFLQNAYEMVTAAIGVTARRDAVVVPYLGILEWINPKLIKQPKKFLWKNALSSHSEIAAIAAIACIRPAAVGSAVSEDGCISIDRVSPYAKARHDQFNVIIAVEVISTRGSTLSHLQARQHGGLTSAVRRKLERLVAAIDRSKFVKPLTASEGLAQQFRLPEAVAQSIGQPFGQFVGDQLNESQS